MTMLDTNQKQADIIFVNKDPQAHMLGVLRVHETTDQYIDGSYNEAGYPHYRSYPLHLKNGQWYIKDKTQQYSLASHITLRDKWNMTEVYCLDTWEQSSKALRITLYNWHKDNQDYIPIL